MGFSETESAEASRQIIFKKRFIKCFPGKRLNIASHVLWYLKTKTNFLYPQFPFSKQISGDAYSITTSSCFL